ncbi:nudC domain-containing protein 3-like isoform X2 [Watersipora subatra]
MKSKNDKIGFPPGVAPQLLIKSYEKFEKLAKSREDSKDTRTIIPSRSAQKDLKDKTAAEVLSSEAIPSPSASKSHTNTSTLSSHMPDLPSQKSTPPSFASVSPERVSVKEISSKSEEKTGDKEQNQAKFQENPESHNGAIRDGYCWAQTINDCDLRIQVPPTVTKGKQVNISIRKKHIKASYTDEQNQSVTLVDSDLPWEINTEESMWSLVPKECIHINVEKVKERWWEHMFLDEPKINTREIEASIPMDQLDADSQSVVDQLMYDEQQKKLGLPTSKEKKMQETLQKAWNAKGSPFEGTPYDPSLLNVSGGNNP